MGTGQDILANSGFIGCLSKAGLAEGTGANTIQIAAPNGAGVDFGIDGIAYHNADTDNIAVTAHAIQAVSTSCLYLVQINAAGTVSTKKGNTVLTANLGVVGGALQWPTPAADSVALGGYKIALNGSTTFTNGSTDIGAGGITETFYDFGFGVPLAPQVS